MRRALALGVVLALAALADDALAEERIRSFHAEIHLTPDARFTVEERIVYDFGDARKRGIFRDIPVRYGRGRAADYRIALDVLSVSDENGAPRPYRVKNEGRLRRIRIGDPDRRVSGVHEYRIRYRVRRGILWFDDHDELYWNATGNDWRAPIDAASAEVFLPVASGGHGLDSVCFTGHQGSVATDCRHEVSGDVVRVTGQRAFREREGLTFAISLPKGVLEEPSDLAKLLDRASDYVSWTTALPVLVLLGMGSAWWRLGRDPSGPVAIPVRYEPPESMTPAEMGTVLDESVDMRDVTATILDLAVRGYLAIEERPSKRLLFLQESDYELHSLRRADDALKPHETELLSSLFGGSDRVKLSELKNKFYKRLPVIRNALYHEVTTRGRWFPVKPDRVRGAWVGIGIAIAIGGVAVATFLERLPLGAALGLSGGVVLLFGRHMPRKTRRGRRAGQHIRGFQEFLERVEADRLERLGMRSVEQFEKLLPYAFVLGVADEWAERFADLYTAPPTWYRSHRGGSFESRRFVADLGRSLDSAGAAMQSRPRSGGSGSSGLGGGGFSGGGFGGGGGGSW